MANTFVGRKPELDLLKNALELVVSTGGGRLVAVRGARQVGKSRLVEQFVERSGVAYGVVSAFSGPPVEVQMHRALSALHASYRPLSGLDTFDAIAPENWFDLLSRLRLAGRERPAIVVVDEFPWAVEADPRLTELLQTLWDQDLRHRAVLMILIETTEATMGPLVEPDRLLGGRIDTTIGLEPFNPTEVASAMGEPRSPMEVFDTRLVTGGFPELVAQASRFPTVHALIEDALLWPHSLFADVARTNLAADLGVGSAARQVLEAIGADEVGVVNFSRIARALGGDSRANTTVTRASETLVEAKRLVAIDVPAGKRDSRLKRYRIANSYLRFWFRFFEPQLRNIEVGRSDLAVGAFRRAWPAWRRRAIEPLAREGVLRLARQLGAPFNSMESVDGWWDRKGVHEYDIVGTARDATPVAIGSIKWRTGSPFDARDLAELAAARSVVPNAGGARLLAIAPRGVITGLNVDIALDAKDLIGAWTSR